MIRVIVAVVLLCSAPALAQTSSPTHADGMDHQMSVQSHNMHGEMNMGQMPVEAGQSAFAALQEIVTLLAADPMTDWSEVNIDALRDHLVDMNAVTLDAHVTRELVEGGIGFAVTGEGAVGDSIRRMVTAHAATMNGVNGWELSAQDIENGAQLTLHVPASDLEQVKALGFFGVMTVGMHHQEHHLMIARGGNPHH